MSMFKNTNSAQNLSILITILLLILASCKSSITINTSVGFENSNKNSNKKEPKDKVGTQTNKVITTARSYKGTHYQFGGCSRSGIDCSGLTQTSFKSVNIELPRTSQEQS